MTGRSDGAARKVPHCTLRYIAVALVIAALAACTPTPPSPSAAPLPRAYTCEQQARLAAEFRALPDGSMLRVAVIDYGEERDKLRALHGIKPERCR